MGTIAASAAIAVIVVGSGFGCRIQIPALRAANFEVVALVGTDADRTARRAMANGVPASFTDLDEAISQTGARVVTVASPPHTHAALTLTAIARGCHVLCEKPFAMNGAEARAMHAAAEKAGVVHMLGNEFRYLPDRAMAVRAVAEGMIGEPRFMTIVQYVLYSNSPDTDLPGWWFDKSAGGGWLGASGSHIIDWVRLWAGEFESVSAAFQGISAPEDGAEDSLIIRFRLKNGTEGVIQQTSGAWGPFASLVRLAGTQGTIWLEGNKLMLADRDGHGELPIASDLQLPPPPPESDDPRQQSPEWRMLASIELAPYMLLCQAFRAAIAGGPAPSPVVPANFADGVASMAVLDAIRESAETHGSVVNIA
jgi:predicted dehydrogenase